MIFKEKQMAIHSLKIGDTLYQINKDKYNFYEITGQTRVYWILNKGLKKARKVDLKEAGGVYSYQKFNTMTEKEWNIKKKTKK